MPPSVHWVMPVDCGDGVEKHFLADALEALEGSALINYVHPNLCVLEGGETTYKWQPAATQDAATQLHIENHIHCCPLFKRRLFELSGGYDSALPLHEA